MKSFPGILDGSGNVWGVRIPDLPGAFGGGATAEDAIASAIAAARIWAERYAAAGEDIPEPRPVEDVRAELKADEALVMIPLVLDAGRTVRVNITIDAGLLEAVDAAAKERGITRSAFLASAARAKLGAA